jgi:hypothetical protein
LKTEGEPRKDLIEFVAKKEIELQKVPLMNVKEMEEKEPAQPSQHYQQSIAHLESKVCFLLV